VHSGNAPSPNWNPQLGFAGGGVGFSSTTRPTQQRRLESRSSLPTKRAGKIHEQKQFSGLMQELIAEYRCFVESPEDTKAFWLKV